MSDTVSQGLPAVGFEAIAHISPEREATFIDVDPTQEKFAGFCADDRQPTDESDATNKAQGFPSEYFRYFGGRYGVSKTTAVGLAVSIDPKVLEEYGGTFLEFDEEVAKRIELTSGVVFGKHSAEKNEENPTDLHIGSCQCMGCLYAVNIGKVGVLNFDDGNVDQLAQTEQAALFGGVDMIDGIKTGNRAFMGHFGLDDKFSIDRTTAIADGSPVSILQGEHAGIDDGVVVVQNFNAGRISNPGKAIEGKVPFYNNDVAAVGEMILKAFPELPLDPKILLGVMDHDIRATRAALAGLEGKSVDQMPLERYGSVDSALRLLSSVRR